MQLVVIVEVFVIEYNHEYALADQASGNQRAPSGRLFSQVIQHLGSQVVERRKHQVIDIADGNPLGCPTPQHIELVPKGENIVCKAARDRTSPATAYQINLRRSPIVVIIN
jgi:hypothetical protein